jgi:hypothetical protein
MPSAARIKAKQGDRGAGAYSSLPLFPSVREILARLKKTLPRRDPRPGTGEGASVPARTIGPKIVDSSVGSIEGLSPAASKRIP